jgi:hypothetical protein
MGSSSYPKAYPETPTALPTHNPACALHPSACLKVAAKFSPQVVQTSDTRYTKSSTTAIKKIAQETCVPVWVEVIYFNASSILNWALLHQFTGSLFAK